MKAAAPPLQAERLDALRSLDILDTPREKQFDDIVELASRICNAPISVVNLVDENRQWFKAEIGLGVRETPLDTSICAHAILEPGLTIIPDTLQDRRLADNPLCRGEPHLRFYAGALLKSDEGYPLGTLCVLDHKPRDLDETQRFALKVLARQVVTQMKLKKAVVEQSALHALANEKTEELQQAVLTQQILTQEADHRVKNSLQIVAAMLNMQAKTAEGEEAFDFLMTARDRVLAVASLHEQLHVAARYDKVDMLKFMERLTASMTGNLPDNITLNLRADPFSMATKDASSVAIVVNELVTNGVKYAFPSEEPGSIEIELLRKEREILLDVSDNGVGFPTAYEQSSSKGLGMRVIVSSVASLGGTMTQHDNDPGSRFKITIPADTKGN